MTKDHIGNMILCPVNISHRYLTSDRWGNFGHLLIFLFFAIIFGIVLLYVNRIYTNKSSAETKTNKESIKVKCVRSYPMLPHVTGVIINNTLFFYKNNFVRTSRLKFGLKFFQTLHSFFYKKLPQL